MQNGTLTTVRVVSSAVIGILAVGGSIFLIYTGHQVPTEFWALAALGITGVVGADVAAAVVSRARRG